jgi:hypothetical protein
MTDDTKKVALLPCPFCGEIPSEVKQWGWHGKGLVMDKEGWAVRVCCPPHTHGNSRDEAIAAWNTRQPQTDALKVAREALEGMVRYAGMNERWQDDNPQYVRAAEDALAALKEK